MKFMDMDMVKEFSEPLAPVSDTMVRLAREYGEEKRSIKLAENLIKMRKESLAKQEAILYDMLNTTGISSFSIEGYTYFARIDMYASVDAANTGQAFAYLENQDLDYLIKRTVNSRSLTSALKAIAEEDPDNMPGDEDGIKTRTVNRVGVRKK